MEREKKAAKRGERKMGNQDNEEGGRFVSPASSFPMGLSIVQRLCQLNYERDRERERGRFVLSFVRKS